MTQLTLREGFRWAELTVPLPSLVFRLAVEQIEGVRDQSHDRFERFERSGGTAGQINNECGAAHAADPAA